MFNRLFTRAGLSLERLRTFCEVADAGSMAKAANGDAVRQSQFSRQIKELEEHFGRRFTERSGRNVVLTSEGRELAALARQILAGLEAVHATEAEEVSELVVLGAGESFLRGVVLPRLGALRARMPKVVLEMRNLRGAEILDALEEGRIDLGVIDETEKRAGVETLRLGKVAYRLVMAGDTNQERANTDWRAAVARPFVVLGGGREWEDRVRALAAHAGGEARVAVRCASWHGVADAVVAVQGAGFLPSTVENPAGCVTLKKPKLALPERTLALAWNARRGDLRLNSGDWRRGLAETLRL